MLAFQNLHQFMFNLSQVTSVVSSSCVRVTSTSSKKNPEIDVYCSESFLNTLNTIKRCDGTKQFKHLPLIKPNSKFEDIQWIYCRNNNFKSSAKKSDKLYILLKKKELKSNPHRSLNLNFDNSYRQKQKNILQELEGYIAEKSWHSNYVSGRSFDENKESSYCTGYNKSTFDRSSTLFNSLLGSLHVQNNSLHNYSVQVRGFKTKRVIEIEERLNPGFFERFSKKNDPSTASTSSGGYSNAEIAKGKSVDTPLLNKMMAGEPIPEEQLKLQASFSEGYRVAIQDLKTPNKTVLSKILSISASIILFIVAIIAFAFFSNEAIKIRINFPRSGEIDPENITVKFTDVKGVEEVKEELRDIVEFLKNPNKFSAIGGKLPKGVLLVGPPGTGKTLLARALAGEAQVPFFHASGSEFDEIFVGEGARRMRNLFKAAKAKAPSIIFIDEIDCVGSKRKNTVLHPYANQTINQLLSEMDGFTKNEGVIIVGATNRKEDLDSALLRPGRFDVEVLVPLPDFDGRKEILELFLGKIVSKDIDVKKIARSTSGCTGADLEAIVNHAAIKAAIDGSPYVTMEYLENAKDKIKIGPERKTTIKSEDENFTIAVHEGGHTVVAYFTEGLDSVVDKVTIVPRGQTLGHTAVVPDKNENFVTKAKCLARLDILLGGRAAEELVLGTNKITANSSDDLEKATEIASAMVKHLGMSDKIGLRTLKSEGEIIQVNQYGQVVTDQVDVEVKRLIQESYDRAKNLLKKHSKEHKLLAEALVKYKTLSPEDVRAILGDNTSEKSSTSSASN